MKLRIDLHTHTVASGHAYSTLQENIKAASEKGLAVLGVTDHAPAMKATTEASYFSNFKAIPREINGLTLMMGVELNILDYEGTIDLPVHLLKAMDIAIASLHPPCIAFGTKKENTSAVIKAMQNPYIHIIGHPGDPRYPLDLEEVVAASEETGTLLEINNASLQPGGIRQGSEAVIREMLQICARRQVPVIAGSDSHFSSSIGDFSFAEKLLEELAFPESLIVNTTIERLQNALKKNP